MDTVTLYSGIGMIASIGIWILNSKILSKKLIKPLRETPYTKFEECSPRLGTINGIGLKFCCGGRTDLITNSQSWYQFFCFLVPLIPIGCYRATQVSDNGSRQSYRIYGHEEWRLGEVLYIYINSIAFAFGLLSLMIFIASFS